MIQEIIVDIREGDDSVRKRILDAITRELNFISFGLEYGDDGMEEEFTVENILKTIDAKFPGHVVINVYDENEELMEIIET